MKAVQQEDAMTLKEAMAEIEKLRAIIVSNLQNPPMMSFDGQLIPLSAKGMRTLIDMIEAERKSVGYWGNLYTQTVQEKDEVQKRLEAETAKAVKEEREACARIADEYNQPLDKQTSANCQFFDEQNAKASTAKAIAEEIRARSD